MCRKKIYTDDEIKLRSAERVKTRRRLTKGTEKEMLLADKGRASRVNSAFQKIPYKLTYRGSSFVMSVSDDLLAWAEYENKSIIEIIYKNYCSVVYKSTRETRYNYRKKVLLEKNFGKNPDIKSIKVERVPVFERKSKKLKSI
jgi:hypothetical protein